METTIKELLGGLALGLLFRIDPKLGLEAFEPFADCGDDLLLVPVDPGVGDDLKLGLVAVDPLDEFGDDLLFVPVDLGGGGAKLLVLFKLGGVYCCWICSLTFRSFVSSFSSTSWFFEILLLISLSFAFVSASSLGEFVVPIVHAAAV